MLSPTRNVKQDSSRQGIKVFILYLIRILMRCLQNVFYYQTKLRVTITTTVALCTGNTPALKHGFF